MRGGTGTVIVVGSMLGFRISLMRDHIGEILLWKCALGRQMRCNFGWGSDRSRKVGRVAENLGHSVRRGIEGGGGKIGIR